MPGPSDLLTEIFGYTDFREGQRAAVEAALGGRDAVVVLPTGGGKSICYQLPAVALARSGRGTTIVVSPLIALMVDQVSGLVRRGVPAAALHSHQPASEQRAVWARYRAGELTLLYVSPERAALSSFQRTLSQVPIAAIAIDEAHCVSQWGHDFRPEYLRLHELRDAAGEVPVSAVTATATPHVVEEIVSGLSLVDPHLIRGDFRRPNLRFSVEHISKETRRIERAIELCVDAGMRKRSGTGRAIIYCATRKKTEAVAKMLGKRGFSAGYYHAGRSESARERAQSAFDLGRTRVLVATNAFGMGIDYPDVRLTIHFQCPGSLSAYYQEAGRSGRDGGPAACVLFFGKGDLVTQRRLALSGTSGATGIARVDANLGAMRRYAEEALCRQQMLCTHFTGEDGQNTCGACDVCAGIISSDAHESRDESAVEPLGEGARTVIVSAANALRKPVGKTNLARALRGGRARALKRLGLLELPQHGALKAHGERAIIKTIEALLEDGRLARRGQKYPTVWPPGKPVRASAANPKATLGAPSRAPKPKSRDRAFNEVRRSLDNYRRRKARSLKWKPYMVFQKRALLALDAARPTTLEELASIPGLGPAKIARFGEDILELIRQSR